MISVCELDLCVAESSVSELPAPSTNSAIKGAPNISGLPESCARVVWYTITESDPATIDPGKYIAKIKMWVEQKDADAFFLPLPGLIRNATLESRGYYRGTWSNTQLCDIEKNRLVSYAPCNGRIVLTVSVNRFPWSLRLRFDQGLPRACYFLPTLIFKSEMHIYYLIVQMIFPMIVLLSISLCASMICSQGNTFSM
jgi:hypothetical protein